MTLQEVLEKLKEQGIVVTYITAYYRSDNQLKRTAVDLQHKYVSYDVNVHIEDGSMQAEVDCNDD